jgi:hypothetical protein
MPPLRREPDQREAVTMAIEPTGQIVVKDNGFTVERADDTAMVSLALLVGADSRGLRVFHDHIEIGTVPNYVTYQITGWDSERAAFTVEKVAG